MLRRDFLLGISRLPFMGYLSSLCLNAEAQPIPWRARTLLHTHEASSTSSTITLPGSVKAGNYAILIDAAGGLTLPAETWPAGWTKICSSSHNFGVGSSRSVASQKILVGGDGGSVLTGMSGTFGGSTEKILVVFPGKYSAATANNILQESTGGAPSAQTVITTGAVEPIIVICYAGGVPNGATASFTQTLTDKVVAANNMRIAYKSFLGGARDITYTYGDAGTVSHLKSFYIDLDY